MPEKERDLLENLLKNPYAIIFGMCMIFILLGNLGLPRSLTYALIVGLCLAFLVLVMFGAPVKNKKISKYMADRFQLLLMGLSFFVIITIAFFLQQGGNKTLYTAFIGFAVFMVSFVICVKSPFNVSLIDRRLLFAGAAINSLLVSLIITFLMAKNLFDAGSKLYITAGFIEVCFFSFIIGRIDNPIPIKFVRLGMKKEDIIKILSDRRETRTGEDGKIILYPEIYSLKTEALLDMDEEGLLFGITFVRKGKNIKGDFDVVLMRLCRKYGKYNKVFRSRDKKSVKYYWGKGSDFCMFLVYKTSAPVSDTNVMKLTYTYPDLTEP